jgi:hypothetical protein
MRFENWHRSAEPEDSMARIPEDGRHQATITSAREAKKKWLQRDKNPDGRCLDVRMDVAGWAVEHAIPDSLTWKVEELCRAAGVPAPEPGEDWDEGQLVGRTVTIDTLQAVSPSGTAYVRVQKYIAAEPKATSQPAAAKRSRPVPPPAPADDDIPF